MTKDKELIEFISTFEMYRKEESGIKPNTVRIVDFNKEQKIKKATHIKIRKGYTKEFFIRKITDKTKWDVQWIISWNPNEKALTSSNKEIKDLKDNLKVTREQRDCQIELLDNEIGELKHQLQTQEKYWENEDRIKHLNLTNKNKEMM